MSLFVIYLSILKNMTPLSPLHSTPLTLFIGFKQKLLQFSHKTQKIGYKSAMRNANLDLKREGEEKKTKTKKKKLSLINQVSFRFFFFFVALIFNIIKD